MLGVYAGVVSPFNWQLIQGEDSIHWARLVTGAAIDAFGWIDVKLC